MIIYCSKSSYPALKVKLMEALNLPFFGAKFTTASLLRHLGSITTGGHNITI